MKSLMKIWMNTPWRYVGVLDVLSFVGTKAVEYANTAIKHYVCAVEAERPPCPVSDMPGYSQWA